MPDLIRSLLARDITLGGGERGMGRMSSINKKPGYHLAAITKGELGELSKIREELDEAFDAASQNCKLMVLLELSDMLGATRAYLDRHHPGTTLDDLLIMADITRRAFTNGRR